MTAVTPPQRGASIGNGPFAAGSPVPKWSRDPSVTDARAMSTTSWDLQ